MKDRLKKLSEALLGIYHWCETENMPPIISENIKTALDSVYSELKIVNPTLSEDTPPEEVTIKSEIAEMINKGKSNSDILKKFKGCGHFIAGIRGAIVRRKGAQLNINGHVQTFKSYKSAFIFVIEYLNKKHNKCLIRTHLEDSGNYLHPQLILKGEPLKEMEKRYSKIKIGYLYKNLNSLHIIQRINFLAKKFNEDIKIAEENGSTIEDTVKTLKGSDNGNE